MFPVVRLTKIFRQAQTSRIIMNAHRINQGKTPDLSNGRDTDFFFVEQEDPEAAAQTVVDLVQRRLPKHYRTSPENIQVLTPMQRGVVGATNLNQILQQAVNPNGFGLRRGGVEYRRGDKVMQIRNNYEKEVFNGDIGVVQEVNPEDRELSVQFDDRLVIYDVAELDELVLAYATTIHKSQGSEYPIVVMPVLMTHYVMLQRNLIYTGVTRAKKALVLVSSKKALALAIRNVTVDKRNTMLKERLRKELRDQPEQAEKPQEPTPKHQDWLKIDLFERLSKSKFRMRFQLTDADRRYISEKGMDTIREHAAEIVRKRLAPAEPANDGEQTPMRGAPKGHPVFLAQHATATCCRGCLEKWHGIPKGRELTASEQQYVVYIIMRWIDENQQGHDQTEKYVKGSSL
jgi:exodeoxyribonuclease V alpha subunit